MRVFMRIQGAIHCFAVESLATNRATEDIGWPPAEGRAAPRAGDAAPDLVKRRERAPVAWTRADGVTGNGPSVVSSTRYLGTNGCAVTVAPCMRSIR